MTSPPPEGDRRDPDRIDRRKFPALSGHLELLSKMSGHLAVTLDIEETIRTALDLIIRYVHAEAGSLFLLDDDGRELRCRASAGPVDITGLKLQVAEGIVGQCIRDNRSRIVRDVSRDPDFDRSVDAGTGFETRSILCVPLGVQGKTIGAIELVNKAGRDGLFSDADLLMLQALAAAAALAIRNARMTEQLVTQERINREIELAIQIQRSLLPHPRDSGYPVSGINRPAREFSGDFYDYFDLEDGRTWFGLGDVSGKGMDAALLMSKTASLFHCLGKSTREPSALLGAINDELCETAIKGMFVTMVCGLYDPRDGSVVLANAGHEPALVHAAAGGFRSFPASAPPLGILSLEAGGDGILDQRLALDGGTLYVFTDGVTEGTLEDGRCLGADGVRDILDAQADMPAVARIRAVVGRLQHGGRRQHDDITMLAVDDRAGGGRDGIR